jgi:predicted TIM-barrel fold metal-dependent hydrolase
MKLSNTAQALYNEISRLTIIDAHEHLPPEKDYLKNEYSGLNFFAGYVQHDLASAGMPSEFKSTMRDPGYRPVCEWWPQMAPYWDKVRHGSYARAACIAARDIYGIDEINDSTIEKLAAGVRADNSTGLYQRVLRDKCKARVVLSCVDQTDFDEPYFKIVPHMNFLDSPTSSFDSLGQLVGRNINTLDDLVNAAADRIHLLMQSGIVVGIKISSVEYPKSDRDSADAVFKELKANECCATIIPLKSYLFEQLIQVVAGLGIPVAVHAGVWGDFRTLDPKNLIALAERFPGVHFDLFHLGMPMVRDAVMIAKNFSNVSLNLCWSPVVSERMTAQTLDEIIDQVPMNKIIAFGGDYRCVVQKAWGHLVIAREIVASVLAGRVEAGEMTEERAFDIAKMWFHDNPSEIYRV